MLTQAEIAVYRRNLENLYTLAEADSRSLLRAVSGEPLPVAAGQLREVMPAIADSYGVAATVIAGEFFLEQQARSGGVPLLDYRQPDFDANAIVQSGIGYGVAQFTNGSSFLNVASILSGTVQKAVAGYARETIFQNSESADVRYKRVARAGACSFCSYMAIEEITFKDARKFHNDCHCVVVPEFQPVEEPEYYEQLRRDVQVGKEQLELDRELVESRWRAENPGRKSRDFLRSKEGSGLTLTTRNYLREIRKVSGRN